MDAIKIVKNREFFLKDKNRLENVPSNYSFWRCSTDAGPTGVGLVVVGNMAQYCTSGVRYIHVYAAAAVLACKLVRASRSCYGFAS